MLYVGYKVTINSEDFVTEKEFEDIYRKVAGLCSEQSAILAYQFIEEGIALERERVRKILDTPEPSFYEESN